MQSLVRTGLLALAALLPLRAAVADPPPPAEVLERLFRQDAIDESLFAESFLAQLPARRLQRIVDDLKRELGPLVAVEGGDSGFVLRFADSELPARMAVDAAGRVTGLWFDAPRPIGDVETLAGAIAELPGDVSLLLTTDGVPRVAHNAAAPLAVGSAMKLAVLEALRREAAAGRLDWSQVVALDPAWRSLPSGQLQDWPAGTPLTIASLAHLMISVSDNTATDALIHLAGRAAVEAVSPRNVPFLTTRELFVLKGEVSAALRRQWAEGDTATRRVLLETLAEAPLPAVGDLTAAPTPEVEWFLSAEELCGLLEATAGMPSLEIDPGQADPAAWRQVSYKGGSDSGVLNLSTRLVGKDGRVHCVVATWNDEAPLQQERLFGLYRGLLARLAAGTR